MNITATVINDTIILPKGTHLEDHTEVLVLPKLRAGSSFLERNREFAGCYKDAPADLADNHDHYLYGAPKQKP